MSGPLGSSQWMYSSGFYPYEIEQSLRFNDDDSAYLSWTPASAGDRKTWTFSCWFKLGNAVSGRFFSEDTNTAFITMNASGTITARFLKSGATEYQLITTAVYRDPSAWYHLVFACDSTQATNTDRMKLYINGEQVTAFSTALYPPLNTNSTINDTTSHDIGALVNASFPSGVAFFDGYMAEVNFIDGTALDPTSFGEFKSGVWVPKGYTGSYGTNGFYLSFADSAAIGDDLSGNGNDWTPSGLASTDVLLDSPTNNYAVLNPTDTSGGLTLSDGSLRIAGTVAQTGGSRGSFGVSEGKWYWEMTANVDTSGLIQVGIAGSNVSLQINPALSVHYTNFSGNLQTNGGAPTAYGATFTTSDVIGVALDMDAGTLVFYKNGVSQGTAATGLTGSYSPWVQDGGGDRALDATFNFGQSPFAYTPPAGFLALNTANLPEPTISPALDDVPADYFNTVLYTGNGLTQSITGVGFQPDWTWIKGRSGATDHALYDAVRGVQEQLESNQTGAETTEVTGLTAVGADGFSVGALAQLNTITATYVAWNWKANGAGVANTDGTISSTVSANQKAGFSIVSYTGDGVLNQSVGHGLGVAPKMTIVKSRDTTDGWLVYTDVIDGSQDYLSLNTTAAKADAGSPLPTASVVYMGGSSADNGSGIDYIAYCFAEVEGYSKFGSYTGNGSADGPFCWNGFKPALIMVKRTDTTSNWTILDDAREGYNVDNDPLYPNLSNAEGTTDLADLLSNGFKLRTTDASVNASGGTYIYAAFASMPFKFSNAR